MAIMQRCCCFPNVRSGSMACGIYSLITSWIYIAVLAVNLGVAVYVYTILDSTGPAIDGSYAAYIINIIVAAVLIIASIVLLVGVSQDIRMMLIPYMVAIMAITVIQAFTWIIFYAIGGAPLVVLIVSLVFWLLFTALNITCLICVISQYQELSEGRGRAMMT